MAKREAKATWEGGLKDGNGRMQMQSGAWEGPYTFRSRFEEGDGTNPEELIAAAHAGCFSMALSATLEKNGFKATRVATTAQVHLDKVITRIQLSTEAQVEGIENDKFQELANDAKINCPVSQALKSVDIELNAKLV